MLLWLILPLSYLIYLLVFKQQKLQLPGPRGLPILGSVFQIDKQRSHVTITKWAKKYGPAFVVYMFWDPVVFINNYETIYDVLVKRGDEFSDRAKFYRRKLASRGWKDIIFTSATFPHWRVIRKAAHKYVKVYGANGSEQFEDLIGRAVNDQLEQIASYQGKPFHVRQQMYEFTACIMYMLLFGRKLDSNSDEARTIKDMTEAFIAATSIAGSGVLLDVFPWLRMFRNKTYRDIMRANDVIDAFWNRQKLRLDNDDHPDCLVKYLRNLVTSVQSNKGVAIMDDINVEMTMGDLLSAGIETTASTLSAFVLLLLHYPEVERKLQQEVATVLGSHDRVNLGHRDHMPYTRAAIYELLRYTAVVPIIGHAASKDTTINGAFIPKGTKVVINLWHLHHDDVFWGDPWIYRPERFLHENGDLLPADHPNRKRLLAFGAGPRVCLGELFAFNRIFLFVVSLIQTFAVTMDTTRELPSCDPHTYVPGAIIHPMEFTASMVTRKHETLQG